MYVVRDRDDLAQKIVPFFLKYPLKTEKANDFALFARVVEWMGRKVHLTLDGMKRIIETAYAMNGNGRYRRRPMPLISETLRDYTSNAPVIPG